MQYPTLDEVDKADLEQICRWYRFLPTPEFSDMQESFDVLSRICQRLKDLGGFTPEISKQIGFK
jgi:hypothetical protein